MRPNLARVRATHKWWGSATNPKFSILQCLSTCFGGRLLMSSKGLERTAEKITMSDSLPTDGWNWWCDGWYYSNTYVCIAIAVCVDVTPTLTGINCFHITSTIQSPVLENISNALLLSSVWCYDNHLCFHLCQCANNFNQFHLSNNAQVLSSFEEVGWSFEEKMVSNNAQWADYN